jgi:transposase-like protein
MDSPSTPRCPLCKSEHTYRMTKKPVAGAWTVARRTWNCVACLHQWLESEAEEIRNPST